MNKLDNDTLFQIFKRTITENRSPNSYHKEYNVSKGYIYSRLANMGVPCSYVKIQKVGQELIDELMDKNSYEEAKETLEKCKQILS